MQPHYIRYCLLAAALVSLCVFSPKLAAQDLSTDASFANANEAIVVNVLVGQSRMITFDSPIERFSVSNPEIAEAVLVTSNQVVVNGKAFGQINFIAWEKSTSRFLVFDVYVRTNLSLIDSQIRALFPKEDIRLSQANGSVVISGNVTDKDIAGQADAVVQAAGFKTVNMLTSPVKNLAQVQLQVRVAEVNRTKLRDYGTSFTTIPQGGTAGYINSGGGPSSLKDFSVSPTQTVLESLVSPALNLFVFNRQINTAAMLRVLRTQGAFRELAEPNLIAMDGQQASFLAGGEFPVPVVQGGGNSGGGVAVTVIFKEYGIRLSFRPTILDEDHIRLELEPEVSTIDYASGVKLDGFVIPGLRTRRAKTGVELRDGQSFALAGLLDNSETKSFSKIPIVSEIPVLGSLFKSKSFQKNETELMFIVTAHLVKPLNRDDLPQIPNVENLKQGSLLGTDRKQAVIDGPSGFSTGGSSKTDATTQPTAAPKAPTPAPVAPVDGPTKALAPGVSSVQAPGAVSTAKVNPN